MKRDEKQVEPDLKFTFPGITVKAKEEGETDDRFIISGMASTDQVDAFNEIVEPGAFKSSLGDFMDFPILLAFHRFDEPVGQVLSAEITKNGLKIEASVDEAEGTPNRVRAQIKSGTLRALSIGFMVNLEDVSHDKELGVDRITDLELLEISVVPLPANRGATFEMAKGLKDRLGRRSLPEPTPDPEPAPEGKTQGGSDHKVAKEVQGMIREMVEGTVTMLSAGADLLDLELKSRR